MSLTNVIFKQLKDLQPVATSHGNGLKKVLLSQVETPTNITQIALTELYDDERVKLHRHETMDEFFIILNGTCDVIVDGRKIQCMEGSFLRVPANLSHEIHVQDKVTMITIGIAI